MPFIHAPAVVPDEAGGVVVSLACSFTAIETAGAVFDDEAIDRP
jgi:hypothetical protein